MRKMLNLSKNLKKGGPEALGNNEQEEFGGKEGMGRRERESGGNKRDQIMKIMFSQEGIKEEQS